MAVLTHFSLLRVRIKEKLEKSFTNTFIQPSEFPLYRTFDVFPIYIFILPQRGPVAVLGIHHTNYRHHTCIIILLFLCEEMNNTSEGWFRCRDSVMRWIFLEGLNVLISTLCVCADGFLGLAKAFHCPIQLLTFRFAFLKLQKFWNAYWYPQNLLICDLWPLIVCKENAQGLTCHRGFRYDFTESQAHSVSIFSVNNAALGSMKPVAGSIFKVSKLFQRGKLKLWFFHQLRNKKL